MTTLRDDLFDDYKDLFSGNNSFYGKHVYGQIDALDDSSNNGNKREGRSWTVEHELTDKEYKDHLTGKVGLGVCPLKEDSTCSFGAIDIDVYDTEFLYKVVKSIYKWSLPLVPFRSKSGGLHLYMFFDVDTKTLSLPSGIDTIRILTKLAQLLGIEKYEVFPKQTTMQKGKKGNWINLPYYDAKNTGQYMVASSGTDSELNINDAVKMLRQSKYTLDKINQVIDALPFGDGPPCLQRIIVRGGPDANEGRNVFLFNSSIYLKEKDHSSLDIMLDDINGAMQKPLDGTELMTICKSVIKKEYTYECHKQPMSKPCDKELCATKKYGVGKSGGLFMGVILGDLIIHRGKGVSYSLEVRKDNETGTIRFDSPKDLMNQDNFISAVLMELNFKVSRVKAEKWDKLLNSALETAEEQEQELEEDNTEHGRVAKLVLKFVTTSMTKNIMDLERGLAVMNEKEGEILFRSDDVWRYIVDTNKQRGVKNSDYQRILKELLVTSKTKRVGNKVFRVRSIQIDEVARATGGPVEPLQDINWKEEGTNEDY